MIEDEETCKVAFRMAALEEEIADRITASLPGRTLVAGTPEYERSEIARAARARAAALLAAAVEFCEMQLALEDAEQAGGLQ